MNIAGRKKEIIGTCLETFMRDGLLNTSMRDLGKALDLDPTALYNHFESKDEVVIACAEEAAIRIENDLIGAALKDIDNPDKLAKDLHDRAVKMRPLMKFFVSVCSSSKYEDAIQPALVNLSERYKYYVNKFAEKLCCQPLEIAPYVYIVINTMLSYMIFGKKSFTAPQLEMAYKALLNFLAERDKKK